MSSSITQFFNFFLDRIPDVLMSEPFIYFCGMALVFCIIGLFAAIINITR